MLHITSAVILSEFAVDRKLNPDILRVRELVAGDNPRANWRKRVERLADEARCAKIATGHIDECRISEHRLHRFAFGQSSLYSRSDDDTEFRLMVDLLDFRIRQHDGLTGSDNRGRSLQEHI